MSTFASRLRDLRVARRFSKSALARAVGVSTTCVWNWEEGNTHPRPLALTRIASTLETTEAFLERGVGLDPKIADARSRVPIGSAPSAPVAEVILRARATIAAAAGLPVNQVKVTLEYGA
jgi:transcriptional regulator with XRE-family HTH domain